MKPIGFHFGYPFSVPTATLATRPRQKQHRSGEVVDTVQIRELGSLQPPLSDSPCLFSLLVPLSAERWLNAIRRKGHSTRPALAKEIATQPCLGVRMGAPPPVEILTIKCFCRSVSCPEMCLGVLGEMSLEPLPCDCHFLSEKSRCVDAILTSVVPSHLRFLGV